MEEQKERWWEKELEVCTGYRCPHETAKIHYFADETMIENIIKDARKDERERVLEEYALAIKCYPELKPIDILRMVTSKAEFEALKGLSGNNE